MTYAIEKFGIRDGDTFGLQFFGTGRELGEAIDEIRARIFNMEICERCGAELSDEDYYRETEKMDSSVIASENIRLMGYVCPHCGFVVEDE